MRPGMLIPRRALAAIDTAVAGAPVTVLAAPPGFAHDRILREWSMVRAVRGAPTSVLARPPMTQRELAELARVQASTGARPTADATVVIAPKPARWSAELLARLVTWAREHAVKLVVTTTLPAVAAPEGVCVIAAEAMVLAPTETRQALADAATGSLTAEEVAAATSGWPGLVSALLGSPTRPSIDRRSFAEACYPVRELVRETVLPWLPPDWLPLLEYAAVADELDAREAEAMGEDATTVLDAARRAALLVPGRRDTSATMVMPVLRDLLVDRLQAQPERLAELRRKIARVRHAAHLVDSGLRAAFELRDWDLCAAIIDERGVAQTFGTSSALSDLAAGVMASLPAAVLRGHATAALLAEVVGVLPPGALAVSYPRTEDEIAHAVRFPDEARRGLERSALGMVSRRAAGDAARGRRLALDAARFAGAVAQSRNTSVGGLSTWWHLQAGLSCFLAGDDVAARTFYRAGWAERHRDELGFAVNPRLTLYPAARGTPMFTPRRRAAIVPPMPVTWVPAQRRGIAERLWRVLRQVAIWNAPAKILHRLGRTGTRLEILACPDDSRELTTVVAWRWPLRRLARTGRFRLVTDPALDHSLLTKAAQDHVAQAATRFLDDLRLEAPR